MAPPGKAQLGVNEFVKYVRLGVSVKSSKKHKKKSNNGNYVFLLFTAESPNSVYVNDVLQQSPRGGFLG
jgi:hypothetical protein